MSLTFCITLGNPNFRLPIYSIIAGRLTTNHWVDKCAKLVFFSNFETRKHFIFQKTLIKFVPVLRAFNFGKLKFSKKISINFT
jgi:hypothetical protein